jgi:hypothetical protein
MGLIHPSILQIFSISPKYLAENWPKELPKKNWQSYTVTQPVTTLPRIVTNPGHLHSDLLSH